MSLRLHLQRITTLFLVSVLLHPVPLRADASSDAERLAKQASASQIPVEQLAEPLRSKVTLVLHKGQIFERGKTEAFPCLPEVYRWLLESPDASLFAWKKLGATKASILRQPDGSFKGTDGMGGELRWQLICSTPKQRIWYAEGAGKMGPLLPTMTVRALVLLTFQEVHGFDGRAGIKHRLELFAHYDSTPLITKLTGLSAESIGKKVLQQMEIFFSGMAWYASEHASWSKTTFGQWADTPEAQSRLQIFLQKLEVEDTNRKETTPTAPPAKRTPAERTK